MLKILFRLKSKLKSNENRNEQINLFLLSRYVKKKNFTLLDAGCGIGSNLNSILKKYPKAKIIGIDNYQPDLEIAQNFFLNKADFILGDCIDTKLNSSSVDVVLSNQVIEHITRYDEYLNEIKRVLKPKGLLILSTPNFHNPKNVLLKLFFQKPIMRWENNQNLPNDKYRGHIKEFYEGELIDTINKHNFKLLESKPIIPKLTLKGNLLFILYRIFEYIFYNLTKPFVANGYTVNHNMIFEKK
tara:strand:+ start:810 stop:1538 length:729 start_codon:yes stop_codon:yes gene_type:complete